jgi:hypothetical protein
MASSVSDADKGIGLGTYEVGGGVSLRERAHRTVDVPGGQSRELLVARLRCKS